MRGTEREIVLDVGIGYSNEIVANGRESLRLLWCYQLLFLSSSSSPSSFPSLLDTLMLELMSNEIIAYKRESLRPLWCYQVFFFSLFLLFLFSLLYWIHFYAWTKVRFSLSLGFYARIVIPSKYKRSPVFWEKLHHPKTSIAIGRLLQNFGFSS